MTAKNNKKKSLTVGVVNITLTFNNTTINVADTYGNVIAWSSAGKNNFKGSRRATPFAAQVTANDVMREAVSYGMRTISSIRVKGIGSGREAAVSAVVEQSNRNNITVNMIEDVTPVPHNGVKPPKRRRV